MVTRADYEFVKKNKNPKIRDEFVKAIDLGRYNEYVGKVEYYFESGHYPRNFLMITIPSLNIWDMSPNYLRESLDCLKDFKPLSTKQKIIVFPMAFSNDYHPVLEDFIGSEKFHEGFHAKEYHERNLLIISPPKDNFKHRVYNLQGEIRAYENQIANFNEKNLEGYIQDILEQKINCEVSSKK